MDLAPVAATSRSPRHRRNAIVALGIAAVAAAGVAIVAPEWRGLVLYGLYAIPAHLLISFLPHEPYLLYAAKLFEPPVVAAVGTLACLIAIAVDYWLIGWVVRHHLVAPRLEQSKSFKTAERWFGKAPFLLIAASAFFPVPFYPAKILAIAADYPLVRIMVAIVIGRFPRFWLLALGGQKVQAPNRWLLYAGLGLAAIAIFGVWRRWRRSN